jgi:hypothetical protein
MTTSSGETLRVEEDNAVVGEDGIAVETEF